jgi:3-oxoacyl-[acyl-carrier protein] reductase
MSELTGKTAIVTGAGRNIGRAIALALAEAGAAVAVVVRENESEADAVVNEIAGKGGKALAILADIADAKAVQAASTSSSTTRRCAARKTSPT